ncbi:MAG TPA: CsbD family protein [Dongiaceae bacterium]|nr:CsbD family protein [Dongiaceae bacterium]
MNEDIIKGKWKQLKGEAKKQWGKLTNDDLDVAEGNRDYLIGRIQERTGRARDIVEREVKEFERHL